LSQLGAGGSQLTAFGRNFPEALENGSLARRYSVASESQQNPSKLRFPGVEPSQAHQRLMMGAMVEL